LRDLLRQIYANLFRVIASRPFHLARFTPGDFQLTYFAFRLRRSVWMVALFLALLPAIVIAADEIRIQRVEIRGVRRINPAALLTEVPIKTGDLFSPAAVEQSIQSLYQTGYFDRVDAESEGSEGGIALVFVVHERPVLVDVTFEGNKKIGADALKSRIDVKTQTFLDPEQLNVWTRKIKAYYAEEGLYHAQVTPVVKPLNEEQAGVVFEIDEGLPMRVRTVRFTGNAAFDARTLQKQIKTVPHFWLTSWWTSADRYQDAVIDADVEHLREFYLNRGHLQVVVSRPTAEPSADKKWIDLTFQISDGPRFTIGKIEIAGQVLFASDLLRPQIQSQPGEIVNREKVRADIGRLIEFYGERGHLFANVNPDWIPAGETAVDLVYRITEGESVTVREIQITGNDKTRDWVIRRELRFNEQETISTKQIRRSYQRLLNLNFFEGVEINPKDVAPGWVDIDVHVKEKLTGVFSIGGNYSSADSLGAVTDVTLGNLFGRGQLMRAKAELGKRRSTFSFTFREPYLFDSDVSGTAEVFNQRRDFTSAYEEKRRGGGVTLGRPFGEYENASLSLRVEGLEIFDVKSNAPKLIRDQAGKSTTHSIGLSLSRDTRDFIFDPTNGGKTTFALEHAGVFLGGDNDYVKATGTMGRYFPLWWDHVLSLHWRVGYAHGLDGDRLPISERFFVGGMNSVRGFKFGKAGPRDPKTDEIFGGDKEIIFNVEYLIPLVPEAKVKAVIFYDQGRGFDDSERITLSGLRQAAGFGLRWFSPIGPLRYEWGWNLRPEPNERKSVQEFSIGALF